MGYIPWAHLTFTLILLSPIALQLTMLAHPFRDYGYFRVCGVSITISMLVAANCRYMLLYMQAVAE